MNTFSLRPAPGWFQPLGLLVCLGFLSACGGGGGGYGGGNSSGYGNTSSSSAPASSSSSLVSSSSAVSSSAASSSVPGALITREITTIGGTFVANGEVDILLNTGGTLSVESQDKTGMTLYIFDDDAPGETACTSEQCITAWPPLLADENATATAPLSIIDRGDGHLQWALRDKPLYFFVSDTEAGDINGEGVNDAWHVATYEPVLLNELELNAADGEYLTASGEVPVGMPDGGNTSFITERLNRDGFSLYTFALDEMGVSNCSGVCLANWPPLLADAGDIAEAPYSIIERSMGTAGTALQWAYHGMPLYFFVGDTAAGQTTGKAIANWQLARPLPTQVLANETLGNHLGAAGLVKSAVPDGANEETSDQPRHGFTLYTFDSDTSGVSNCSDACLTNWPALIAHEGAVATDPYSLVERASGEFQWALNGMPLYFFAGDTAPGQTNGEGMGNNWYVARTAPVAAINHTTEGRLFVAHGNIVDADGDPDNSRLDFTLYTFDEDPLGETTCFDGCLVAWPALYAPEDAQAFGDFTVIVRDEVSGDKQWAYKGKPLYFYVGDTAAGDVTGEYTDWTIARP